MPKTHKLYCYVDETGQDTKGSLFIVVAVIVAGEREELDYYLEQVERTSGIGRKKWVRAKSSPTASEQYLEAIKAGCLKDNVFYRYYTNTGTGAFEHLTVLAIAQAVNLYRQKHCVSNDYKVSVTIDGLKGSEGPRIGRQLRELGIKSRKVRGARDESEPIVRLADRLAGLVRDAQSDDQTYKIVRRQLEKQGIITKL